LKSSSFIVDIHSLPVEAVARTAAVGAVAMVHSPGIEAVVEYCFVVYRTVVTGMAMAAAAEGTLTTVAAAAVVADNSAAVVAVADTRPVEWVQVVVDTVRMYTAAAAERTTAAGAEVDEGAASTATATAVAKAWSSGEKSGMRDLVC